jgi:hypothetical protein
MQYAKARPDVVRAINQRWLLKFWKRSRPAHGIPSWRAVETEDLSRLTDGLSFLDVAGSGDAARFRIDFHGATVGKVYGSPDCRGRYIDDVFPGVAHVAGLAPYRMALKTAQPVYTIHDLTDKNGRVINFERLLLPFADDGKTVDRIMASFEFICEDGAFHSEALLMAQPSPPPLRLCATIEAPAVV